MTFTPNAMPRKANKLHQQLLASLIETKPVKSTFKSLSQDENGKEVVNTAVQVSPGLRFPLAQNVSSLNVNRAAKEWIK